MKKFLLGLALAGALVFGVAVTHAQTVFRLYTAVTGSEIIADMANATGGQFQAKTLLSGLAYASTHGTTTPALTSCGTTPTIVGTDVAGLVTMGTGTPTGCVITFGTAYGTTPICVVSWIATPLVSQSYVTSTTAITLTQTATSSNVVQYHCLPRTGV